MHTGTTLIAALIGIGGGVAMAADGTPRSPRTADFQSERTAPEVRRMADWIVRSRDNQGMPYLVIDKTDARVYVFQADGQLRAAASALLGMAVGDESAPDIGQRQLSRIRPDERTTPAGRFVASLGRNLQGGQILWVDYESALSLHPVVTNNPKERRVQRLPTPTPLDNRISYGCINVSADFFKQVVSPAFAMSSGVVYILPETRSLRQAFPTFSEEEVP